MSVDQMLAHLTVPYDMTLTEKYPKPNFISRFFIKLFAKKVVTTDMPYPKNGQTAPQFIINDKRDFEKEKAILIENINKVLNMGAEAFDGKESHSFGPLSTSEWNILFSKHLDHHLKQFGV